MSDGINSKERVKEFGEVFTPDSIVNDMLDLMDKQLPNNEEYITQTVLEPACGDGQFLIQILYRKLLQVQKLPIEQRQINLIKALSSIYGVDIQKDNVKKAKERMEKVATGKKVSSFDLNSKKQPIQIDLGIEYTEQLIKAIKHILKTNIIVGNTLEPDKLELTAYHYTKENKVWLAKADLKSLIDGSDEEHDKTNEVAILDIMNAKPSNKASGNVEEFDF